MDSAFLTGSVGKISPITWHSSKLRQLACLSSAGETQAENTGCEQLEFMRFVWAGLCSDRFDIQRSREHIRSVPGVLYWMPKTFMILLRGSFVKLACKVILRYGAGAKFAKIWPDLFGTKISYFWSVLESLSIVFNFLLSSPRLDHVVSDTASISS